MILHDIRQAWDDYVDNTIAVTVTSTGVPAGQSEFNHNEKVTYDLKVTNGTSTDGVQVKDIRVHVHANNASGTVGNVFEFIIPPTTVANAFPDATSTVAFKTSDPPQTALFLETSSLATLSPGESVTISGLEVIGKSPGTATLGAHVHATPDLDQLFPPDTTGTDGAKTLTVKT